MGGKPSKGTKADKRLAANKSAGKVKSNLPFGGKKAAPFKKGGGRRKG